jgi:hypothetical protein
MCGSALQVIGVQGVFTSSPVEDYSRDRDCGHETAAFGFGEVVRLDAGAQML